MSKRSVRVNDRIRVPTVRLIGPEGEQIGIVPIQEAQTRARDLGLDLVEVSPTAKPPVCRVMDYGKYKYELAKREKQAKKKQHAFQLKEMRYRPKIDEHDYQFKTKHVTSFLEAGSKVKVMVFFRGREMSRQEFGRKILDRLKEELDPIAVVDSPPKMEGRNMTMVLSPRPEVVKKAQEAKVAKGQEDEERKAEEKRAEKERAREKNKIQGDNKDD
ncbi:translation initiation factor IF-3 [candidate division GN15 bacterium]|nr:translation initiation factor IF-3 [candidate division GN15 bacterium]